jgi:selenide,water dikinase
MQPAAAPVETDIVLVGAGHAHVQVMRAFGMHPLQGSRITIVTDRLESPYSGMLPGCIAGDFPPGAMLIDIARLARATGCRLVRAEATGIDRAGRRLLLADRPPLAYDLLSFDVGITPDLAGIEGAAEHAIPVKPIAGFLRRLQRLEASLGQAPRRVAVIGGGPAGIELAFAFRDRWRDANVTLLAGGGLAPSLPGSALSRIRRALTARGIDLVEQDPAERVAPDGVRLAGGRVVAADAIFASTAAKPAAWLTATDLPKADNGGIAIRPTLQALDDDRVFAAGDCATMPTDPRPRAGVFAVRQGPVLARNLRAAAEGERLEAYRPQKRYLAILRTARDEAIATRDWLPAVEGRWVRRWKDRIDQAFMERFAVPEANPADELEPMRCGGCAAKVGPGPLAEALSRLPPPLAAPAILQGLDRPDDAALLRFDGGPLLAETVDQIRAFIGDPYLFGRIAANHALNDIHAMGATPHHALAIATIPFGPPAKVADELHQLLAGARRTLDEAGCALVGGHSAEGETLALGLAATGRLEAPPLAKRGARPGDRLILTKALGTGILFAADMRAAAPASAVETMLAAMIRSNADAARLLRARGATAMTDVSGFGLLGHLVEMLGDDRGARLRLDALPLADGVAALAAAGHASSLLPENALALRHLADPDACDAAWRRIILDPQTAGGLLAAVPPENVAAALAGLAAAGYDAVAEIGAIERGSGVSLA